MIDEDDIMNRTKKNIVEKNITRRKVIRAFKLFTLVIGCVAHYYTTTYYYRSTLGVNGAEINATHEWTLVQEGDTISAGLHVRMDLSTGEKWVKLIDEDEEDNNNIMDDTEKIRAVEISADGKNTAVTTSLTTTITDSTEKQDKDGEGDEGEPKYDFMMMHRTLSKLDNDEIERMGGLPEIPLTSKHHQQQQPEWIDFESRMLEIWTARQTELQELSQADLPKIIKDLINCLKQYIEMGKVKQFQFEGFFGDIIDVLKDLEFHMSDIDMARDFHTLDGWHLLVSLLDDSTHMKAAKATETENENKNENDENSKSFVEYKQRVQSTAAWAIGTAIKNTEEFFSWSIENILTSKMKSLGYDHPISRGGGVTVIDLLLEQLNQTTAIIIDNYSTNDRTNKDTSNRIPLMYKQKLVYALGSSLRLNNVAQEYFESIGGPLILGEVMEGSLKTLNLMDAKDKRKEYKSTLKLLTLVSDIITYLQESLAEGMFSREEFSAKISQYTSSSFSKEGTNNENNIWCKSALTSLQDAHILKDLSSQEKVLEILSTLGPFCKTHDNPDASSTLREFLQGLLKEYRGMEQSDLSEDDEDDLFGMDEEWKYDIIKVAENILDAIN